MHDDVTVGLIKSIAEALLANRPGYYVKLPAGVTDAELDLFEQRFSLQLPAAFRALYKWKNGQPASCSESLHGNRMFSPLEAVTETKELLDGMIGFDFEDERWWRRGWIPFLSNGGGDHLCLDIEGQDGGQPGQIIAFWHDWEDRSVEWPTFDAWLEQLAIAAGVRTET